MVRKTLYVRPVTDIARPLTQQELVVGLTIPLKRDLLPNSNRRPWVKCLENLLGALQAPLKGIIATELMFFNVVDTVLARA